MSLGNVLIVDDHSSIRKGLRFILSDHFPNTFFYEASGSVEALNSMQKKLFDLLILDVRLPDKSGLDLLQQIRDKGNETKVLVFSFHKESTVALRAMKIGANAYLSKDSPEKELIKAINIIIAGKKYIPDNVTFEIINQFESGSTDPLELLSNREYQTLVMIATGKTVSEIASSLSLSVSTINTYRARILEKIGLTNNNEIIRFAIHRGLV